LNWVFESSYRVKLLNSTQVLEFNFLTRLDTFSKKIQLNSTWLIYKYWCRINIHLSYKLKEHFSNVLSFWRLDNELINQRKHRLDDVNLWSRWIKTHSWTWAVQSSNEACLLFNSNEAHHFVWLLHAVISYYFSVFSLEFLISWINAR